MNIGLIGAGIMGRAIGNNILKAGHDLVVYDIYPEAIQRLIQRGALSGESPKDVARKTEVIITMLPFPRDIETVVFGENGILQGVKSGSIFVDMSTSDPLLAQRIAEALEKHGVAAVDCPVGGGEPEAISGQLVLIAGGAETAIERIRPLLMCIGREIIHCGGPGTGQAMKLTNNMLGAIIFQASAEALSLGMCFGISLETMLAVLSKTAASNAVLTKALPAKAFKGNYEPGFRIRLAKKDVGLAVELAKQLDVPIPLGALTLQRCASLVAEGYGDQDISAIVRSQADLLKLDIRTES